MLRKKIKESTRKLTRHHEQRKGGEEGEEILSDVFILKKKGKENTSVMRRQC
jgi:hypothetical protein